MKVFYFGVLRSIVRQTLLGMSRRLTTQWVMIACVAAMQSILAATLLLAFNLDRLSEQWERGGDVLVFLKPSVSQTDYEQLTAWTQSVEGVDKVILKTPVDALHDLQSSLGDEFIDDSFGAEVLPATIEIDFAQDYPKEKQLEFRAKLLQMPEIDQVETVIEGRGLLAKLYELRETIALWRWIVGIWVGLSVMFVFSQFVRLNLHQRKLEVEVLTSVGATRTFILAPLVIEGALQAALGSGLALWIVESILSSQEVGTEMIADLLLFSPEPLSFHLSLAFILISVFLGILASWRSAVLFMRNEG